MYNLLNSCPTFKYFFKCLGDFYVALRQASNTNVLLLLNIHVRNITNSELNGLHGCPYFCIVLNTAN